MVDRVLIVIIVFLGFTCGGNIYSDANFSPLFQETNNLGSSYKTNSTKVSRHLASIFGDNNRSLIGSNSSIKKIKKKVGKLIGSNGLHCTASLVGDNLILTAAHCLTIKGSSKLSNVSFTFYLGYDSGKYIAKSQLKSIWWGDQNAAKAKQDDWILLSLEKNLGYKYGYFGTHTLRSANFSTTPIALAGYGDAFFSAKKLSAANSCRIRNHLNGDYRILLHDCNSGEGDSGAPLFFCNSKECKIVAIHVSDSSPENTTSQQRVYTDELGNIAISSSQFENDIRELRRNQN